MSDGAETAAARRPPGRPRSERSHQAIVVATLELLAEQGFQQLTMEQVARRAGVGKATIYRRWPAKAELVKDAIRYFSAELPDIDTGSLAGDYQQISQAVLAVARDRSAALLMPRLLSEVAQDPEMHAVFSKWLVEPRRAVLRTVLRRAVERGELREDIDPELLIDMLVGPVIYRFIISGGDMSAAAGYAPRVLAAVHAAFSPPPAPDR
jgi:AcrR family transcriptional regulator